MHSALFGSLMYPVIVDPFVVYFFHQKKKEDSIYVLC